ncbi:MAG: acetyl-CoA carboxylase biotin carboxylase subunit [Gemmatimonadales bacterium]
MNRVLVANRGEIALRIVRACHEEGVEAVAVYSDADRTAPYVRAADHAIHIGPAAPLQSYLLIDRLLDAAGEAGADAVHPGYGFLAERAAFAEAVEAAGLIFVGPPAAAIRAMGDKTEARRRMREAGVSIVPGGITPLTDVESMRALAEEIGYPVMVKAAAGGGGRGMRLVARDADLAAAVASAAAEAVKAFGDGGVYVEKYIERPRHIEFQVLADAERTVHLGERECSVQRRHQKLVEEAPSVAMTSELREWMGAAAVAAAEAVGYLGAGTCEFLLAADRSFYFLEMNTRIQVEHPITEMVYGIDLVREQLRIASGLPMRVPAGWLHPRGWAIECRITSEDPSNGFLPSTGRIRYLRAPSGPGVRWDSGVEAGDQVTLHYDSMLAKLIVWAPEREQAIGRMSRALDELVIAGVATNQGFHRRLMADPAFREGEIDVQFLERRPDLMAPVLSDADAICLAIATALAEEEARQSRRPTVAPEGAPRSAWLERARAEGLQ